MTDADDDPHAVLGVRLGATQAEIRNAYKQRALECHPDKRAPGEREESTKAFQKLSRAYSILLQGAPDSSDGVPAGQHMPEPSTEECGMPFSHDALHTFFVPRAFTNETQSEADADVLASVEAVSNSSAWTQPYRDMIAKLVRKPTPPFILQSLESLSEGEAVAFWLRAQNAVLHIERLPHEKAMLRAWRVQLPSQDVMGMIPPCLSVPAVATCAPWGRVMCLAFCTVVADLAEQELCYAASKVQQDAALPVGVLDYLLPVVCGESADLQETKYVWKKAACTQELRQLCTLC